MTKQVKGVVAAVMSLLVGPSLAEADGGAEELSALVSSQPSPEAYGGPKVVSPRPPGTMQPQAALEGLRLWYALEVGEQFGALSSAVKGLEAKSYNEYLAGRRAAAAGCAKGLPAEVSGKAVAYLRASGLKGEAAALQGLKQSAASLGAKEQECVAAVAMKTGAGGVFLSGLTVEGKKSGAERLKPTVEAAGFAYVIAPQVVTAYPGREDSVVTVLDPQQGPWRVVAAQTAATGKFWTHHEKWKMQQRISIRDYLQQKTETHLLLVEEGGRPLGWLDQDEAAFFSQSWHRYATAAKEFYTSGGAAFMHGAWWDPEGYQWAAGQPAMMTNLDVYDFVKLVRLLVWAEEKEVQSVKPGQPVGYPEVADLRRVQVGSLKVMEPDWEATSEPRWLKLDLDYVYSSTRFENDWSGGPLALMYFSPAGPANPNPRLRVETYCLELKNGRFVHVPFVSKTGGPHMKTTLKEIYGLK